MRAATESHDQVCANSRPQVTLETKCCTLVPNIFGSTLCGLLHVIFLAPIILRWLQSFWKFCATLVKTIDFR
jgi:hypothetical protein